MEISRSKQAKSFKLHAVLNSVKKTFTILLEYKSSFFPAYSTGSLHSSHLTFQINCCGTTVLIYKNLVFHLILAPKNKSRDSGNLDTSKRRPKMLPLKWKVNCFLKLITLTVRRKYSICRIQNYLNFLVSTEGSWNLSPKDNGGWLHAHFHAEPV